MQTGHASKIFLLALVVFISALFLEMVRPFILAMIVAGIFSSLANPVYLKLKKAFGDRAVPASLTTLILIVLTIILPLGFLTAVVTAEAIKVGESVTPWVHDQINNPDEMVLWLHKQPFYDRIAPYQGDILTKMGEMVGFFSRFLINSLSTATAGTIHFLFLLMIMLYSMFFFLMQGDKLVNLILYYMPLEDGEERRLLDKFSSVTRATLKGTAVIGILQGGTAGLAFMVVGIPSSIFWGTIMVVMSIIPGIGTALVWVPATVILIAGGSLGKGIGLALFCGVVVGSIDNFVRPALVGKDTEMPDLMILLSTLGGMAMFGALGLILGPIIGALFITVWEMYGTVFREWLPAGRGYPAIQDTAPDDAEDSD